MSIATAPIKQFEIINNGAFTARNLEVRHAGIPFVWAKTPVSFFSGPMIEMHTGSPEGDIIAAAKLPNFTSNIDILLGNPHAQSSARWTTAYTGWTNRSWKFPGYGNGREYEWRRTHQSAFGSSMLSNSDFKLVDPANNDKVLAVYIKHFSIASPNVGHIDFMVELGPQLELQALSLILGIEERLRRRQRHGGAATAASAAGSAAGGF